MYLNLWIFAATSYANLEDDGIKIEPYDEDYIVPINKKPGRTTRNSRKSIDEDYNVEDTSEDSDSDYQTGTKRRKKTNSVNNRASLKSIIEQSTIVTNETPMSTNLKFAIRCTKCNQKFMTQNRMLNHIRGYHESKFPVIIHKRFGLSFQILLTF